MRFNHEDVKLIIVNTVGSSLHLKFFGSTRLKTVKKVKLLVAQLLAKLKIA